MLDSADRTMESEPLKSQREEAGAPNGRSCTGKARESKLSGWRTAAFLLSMFICLSVVFAFSFILPCPVRPQYLPTWNLTVPAAVTYNFLAVGDVNQDKVLDVFLIYKSLEGHMNHTCNREGPCLFFLAVDGTDGKLLWEQPLAAEFDWAECGVGGVKGKEGNLCVVAHNDHLTAIDMHTGKILWQVSSSLVSNMKPPVLKLPDLNNDKTNDFAVLNYSNTSVPSVTTLIFFSGKSGEKISEVGVGVDSGPVKSHLQFSTESEAQYILLHTVRGLYAVSLGRLAESANLSSNLKGEKSWDQKANNQGLITLYDSLPLQSVLKVRGGYSSSSPSLMLQTNSTVMLFDTQKLLITWTTNISKLISSPSFGHFNKDGVPDIVLEEDQRNSTKRVVIVDGQKGSVLWEVILPFNLTSPQPASILTLNYYSVFMLWGDAYTHISNMSLEVEGRASYLLHPLHSDVLLERRNPTQHIVTFRVLLLERGRHACYLVLSEEGGARNKGAEPDSTQLVVLTKQKIKSDISQSSVLGVGGAGSLGGDVSEQVESVKEAFYRLRFSDQAQ